MAKLCERGCGKYCRKRFIRGHNTKGHRTSKEIICDACNTKFMRWPSWIKDKNYCSRKCIPRKGIPTWNKGIPMTEQSKKHLSEVVSNLHKNGVYNSPETKSKLSSAMTRRWESGLLDNKPRSPMTQEHKQKIRDSWTNGSYDHVEKLNFDNHWSEPTIFRNIQMKSKLEARVAKIMYDHGIAYEYEPKRFKLTDGRNYLPDFYLPEFNIWLDPKGWDQNLDKIELFKSMGNTILLIRDNDLKGLETNLIYITVNGRLTLLTEEDSKYLLEVSK